MRFSLLLLAILTSSVACAAEETPYIAVTANGWVEAVPDMLTLDVTVRATGTDMSELQQRVETTTRQAVSAAQELGVAEGDIDSASISIRPEYEWQNQKRIYRGQSVQRSISIKLRDLERYGELVMALSRYKLHSMGQPQLGHSNLDELRLAALDKALEKGRGKAKRIAQGSGVSLGPVIRVEELGAATPAPTARMLAAESAMAPEIDFGKRRISASVTMRFAIR